MTRWNRLLPSERLALPIFLILFATSFVWATVDRAFWMVGVAGLAFLWLVAILLALFHLCFAFRDEHSDRGTQIRSALAIPAAVVAAFFLGGWIGPRAEASIYLALHSAEMRHAQLVAGKGEPASIPYAEGVPDGGKAIIRSTVHPSALPQSKQVSLTGERIAYCRRIIPDAWLCAFD